MDIGSKLGGLSGSSIVQKLKEVYFFFEDKYYTVLDKINRYVPIYKIVDPIDKVFPSFALLILLVLFVILLLVFFPLFAVPLEFETVVKVTDTTGKVLEGATVTLSAEELLEDFSEETDAWGEVQLKIPAEELSATATVSKSGFETEQKEILLIADQTRTIKLSPEQVALQPPSQKTILLINSKTGLKLSVQASVEFSCSSGDAAPPTQTRSDGTFKITPPGSCGMLTATARANGFGPRSKIITQSTTRIELTPVETKGRIQVTMKNSDGTNAADVQLSLIDETTNAEVDSGSTASSGGYKFEDVEPGTYKINASPTTGAPAIKTGISVEAGRTTYVTINLPEVLEGKNLFIKTVDVNGNAAVAGATVFFYAEEDRLDSKTTGSDGTVRQAISDDTLSYSAVVTHQNYLTKIVADIPVKDAADTSPYVIQLTKKITVPPVNHPVVFVKVLDETGAIVEDASVWIYDESYPQTPLNHPAAKTNADGNVVFQSLAPATYFARALAEQKDGESEHLYAAAAETVFLEIVLVLGEGDVEVTVFDAETAEDVENVTVEFIGVLPPAVAGQVIDSCTTDPDGECTSNPIAADKIVYVRASADGYLSALSDREISIVDSSTERISIGLTPTTSIPDEEIITEYVMLCRDWECTKDVSMLQSDEAGGVAEIYYACFNLILPKDQSTYTEVKQHIRVGPNDMVSIPVQDYRIKIKDARAAAGRAILSGCWDETSGNFYNPPECSTLFDAKMVNVEWDEMQQAIIPVTVKFVIEPGLEDGTEIPIYYQAKAELGSGEYTTLEKVKLFKIGEVLCEGQKFAWGFEVTAPDGNTFSVQAGEDGEPLYPLMVSTEYTLDYWIYNCSDNDVQASLKVKNQNPSNAIGFPEAQSQPLEVATFAFPKDTIISSADGDATPINMLTLLETGGTPTDVVSRLDSGLTSTEGDGHENTIYFSIMADGTMNVISLPERLSDIAQHPNLSGIVVDAGSEMPIAGASVKVIVPPPAEQTVSVPDRTGTNGYFSFGDLIDGPLMGVSEVALEVRKSGYRTFNVPIPVGGLPVVWSPDFECIDIDKNRLYLQRNTPILDSFNVETNDCNRMVEVILESELVLRLGGRIIDSSDGIVLGETDFQEIAVAAELPLDSDYPLAIGEYYINVRARFDQDDDGSFTAADGPYTAPLKKARVFITDPGSCFRLADPADSGDADKMKSSFDLKGGEDEGLIINECFRYVEDSRLPMLEIVRIHGTNPNVLALEQPPLRMAQPELHDKSEIVGLKVDGKYEHSVSDNRGFVELQYVDFYMTDEEHNAGDRHRVWAQLHREGCDESPAGSLVGDCFNITGQYPLTRPTTGCIMPGQDANRCLTPDHPIISNSTDAADDGWVDTDTYHPTTAQYETQVTNDHIWQGSHNVCNNQPTCSVAEFRIGANLRAYFIGMEADKFILEVEGDNTWLDVVEWRYFNYDIDHEGRIDFTAVNNGIAGETYALIKATDTVLGEGGGQQGDVPFNWTVVASGIREWTETDSVISTVTPIAVEKMIGVAANPNAPTRTNVYDFNTSLDLSDPASFALDSGFQGIVNELTGSEVSVESFTVDLSNICDSDPQCLRSFFVFFYMSDGWHFGARGEQLDTDGIFIMDFGSPQDIFAYALVNDGESGDGLTVELFEQEIFHSQEEANIGSDTGSDVILAGESSRGEIYFDIQIDDPTLYPIIVYTVSTTTSGVNIHFNELGDPRQTEDPNAEIVAEISTEVTERNIDWDYFHIRLEGEEQTECFSYGGTYGATGERNKPRVRFNWDWDRIDIDTCSKEIESGEDNPDYIYCDSTQFAIFLLHRLERIRDLAETDLTANLSEIQGLKISEAYLIEDGITPDFRSDLSWFLTNVAVPDPEQTLLAPDHPWQNYLGDTTRLNFAGDDPAVKGPGLYEVFITLSFEGADYVFFYETGGVMEMLGNITVNLTKIADPIVDNPFYRLPIDGTVGKEESGYDRQGYGIGFENFDSELQPSNPILLVGEIDAPVIITEAESDVRTVQTIFWDDFEHINNANKGELLSIAKTGDIIHFSRSIATPILIEMNSANGKAEVFYHILDTGSGTVLSSAAGFVNLWTLTGSTIGEPPQQCRTFLGTSMEYRQQDRPAASFEDSCSVTESPSYGFYYGSAAGGEKMFVESVFFVPTTQTVVLKDSCSESGVLLYSSAGQAASSQIGLSDMDGHIVSSVQDVIDLIGDGYICISEDSDYLRFWWNPQKLQGELDTAKSNIPNWSEMECTVSQTS